MDHDRVVSLVNVLPIPGTAFDAPWGYLNATQEAQLARAVVLAYDLEVPLLG
ncbi:MAG: hypothetical protein ABIQ53_02270 [Terracoccus sp.]